MARISVPDATNKKRMHLYVGPRVLCECLGRLRGGWEDRIKERSGKGEATLGYVSLEWDGLD